MISTGIVRKLDNLGRISIPKEIRTIYFLDENAPIRISLQVEFGKYFLSVEKHSQSCIFCNSKEGITEYMGKKVCPSCINSLMKLEL